jgi:hypothetical protein
MFWPIFLDHGIHQYVLSKLKTKVFGAAMLGRRGPSSMKPLSLTIATR